MNLRMDAFIQNFFSICIHSTLINVKVVSVFAIPKIYNKWNCEFGLNVLETEQKIALVSYKPQGNWAKTTLMILDIV